MILIYLYVIGRKFLIFSRGLFFANNFSFKSFAAIDSSHISGIGNGFISFTKFSEFVLFSIPAFTYLLIKNLEKSYLSLSATFAFSNNLSHQVSISSIICSIFLL
jgi:hypothetical protein